MVLLADTFDEYTVTAAVAMDTGPEDLPIILKLTHTNYVVGCIELLMEENLEFIAFFVCFCCCYLLVQFFISLLMFM